MPEMDRKNENVEDIIETLEKAANLLKGILGMPRDELYDLLTKRRQVKNEASKKYYEKNREAINEARKAKYAEKVKAKKADKSSDEKTEDNEVPAPVVEETKPVPKIGKKKPKTQKEFIEEVKQL